MNAAENSYGSPVERVLEDGTVATHPFITDLDAAHASEILKHSRLCFFDTGEYLFREGEPADRLFLLLNGLVAIETHAQGGHMVRICTARGQDVVGWSWLFPPFAWHFQAQALEPTTAVVCDGAHLLVMCEEDPAFGYQFMKRIVQLLIHRLQATRGQLISIEAILNPPAPRSVVH